MKVDFSQLVFYGFKKPFSAGDIMDDFLLSTPIEDLRFSSTLACLSPILMRTSSSSWR